MADIDILTATPEENWDYLRKNECEYGKRFCIKRNNIIASTALLLLISIIIPLLIMVHSIKSSGIDAEIYYSSLTTTTDPISQSLLKHIGLVYDAVTPRIFNEYEAGVSIFFFLIDVNFVLFIYMLLALLQSAILPDITVRRLSKKKNTQRRQFQYKSKRLIRMCRFLKRKRSISLMIAIIIALVASVAALLLVGAWMCSLSGSVTLSGIFSYISMWVNRQDSAITIMIALFVGIFVHAWLSSLLCSVLYRSEDNASLDALITDADTMYIWATSVL